MRSSIFKHLDGIALCPTFLSIHKRGIFNEFSKEKISLSYLVEKFQCNEGYLNVALRLFCCQGWLKQEINEADIYFRAQKDINFDEIYNKYKIVEKIFSETINYQTIVLDSENISNKILFDTITEYLQHNIKDKSLNIEKHVEGVIIAPILVHFSRHNFLNQKTIFSLDFIQNNDWKSLIKNLLIKTQLINSKS